MTNEKSDYSIIDGKWYSSFLADIKTRIKSAQFFEAYSEDEKLSPLVREISWSPPKLFLGDLAYVKHP